MEIFKEKFSENLMALIYIIIGILMFANPKFVCDAVNYIIGALIIVFGIIFVVKLLQNKAIRELSKIELLIAFLCLGLGLYLIFNSNLLVSLLPICAGILIFLDAVSQIMKGFRLKKANLKYWYLNLIIGLIFMIFAIYIVVNATSVSYLVVRLIGLVLIIDGIFEIYTYFRLREYNDSVSVIETEIVTIKKK